jgi:hypothetical protein
MCTRLAAGGDFDYGCVLGAAVMFYEAQRSGKLPAGNRIPWRGNAGLQDKAPNGASLVGGWCVERAQQMTCFNVLFSFACGFTSAADAKRRCCVKAACGQQQLPGCSML